MWPDEKLYNFVLFRLRIIIAEGEETSLLLYKVEFEKSRFTQFTVLLKLHPCKML